MKKEMKKKGGQVKERGKKKKGKMREKFKS